MIRILHITSGLNLGGAETTLFKICINSDKSLFEHIVISLTDSGYYYKNLTKNNIKVYTINFKKNIFDLLKFIKLIILIKRLKPSIVQTWMYHADIIGSIATRFVLNIPIVWNIRHGSIQNKFSSRIFLLLLSFFSKIYPSEIISCSIKGAKFHIDHGYQAKKISIINNGFDTNHFHKILPLKHKLTDELNIPRSSYIVLYPARFHDQKNHSMFIKAASKVIKTMPNVFFILCGKNINYSNKGLMKLLKYKKVKKNFLLLDIQSDMRKIYSSANLTCLTSSYGEAFPNIIAESMACEVPCFSTPVGDAPFIIGDSKYIVDFDDYKKLSELIIEFLSKSENERSKIGNLFREKIKKNYDIDKLINNYEKIYFKLSK